MLAVFIKFMLFFLAHLIPLHTDKVFSFLSKDEVEKLKQEEEKKIATLQRGGSGKKNKAIVASDLVDASNQVAPGDKDAELDNEDDDDDDDEEEDEDDDEETDDTDEDDDDEDDDDEDDDQDDQSRGSR